MPALMTHILLLFAVELYLNGWPSIGFRDNIERPGEESVIRVSK